MEKNQSSWASVRLQVIKVITISMVDITPDDTAGKSPVPFAAVKSRVPGRKNLICVKDAVFSPW